MGCLRPYHLWLVSLLILVQGLFAQDCFENGVTYTDQVMYLSDGCDKVLVCSYGEMHVVAETWKCPTNAHCVDGVCHCDAKYANNSVNTYGWISSCKRVDFSCDYNGVTYQHNERWLINNCTEKKMCHTGHLLTVNPNYNCFFHSHCENETCVCDDNYNLVITEQYTYCERASFDCTHEDGTVLEDGSTRLTDDCSKLLKCSGGTLDVKEQSCAENMHCDDGACLCDEKYRPAKIRNGLVEACYRYDFSCEEDGVKRDEGTYWLSSDCTKMLRCSRGNILEEDYECPALSHCENRMCYCDEGFEVAAMLSSGRLYACRRQRYDVNCTSYFYEQFGMCLRDRPGQRDYAENAALCQSRDAELMIPDRLSLRFKQLSTISLYQNKRFFLGGSPIFDDISALPINDETKDDRAFIADMIQAYSIRDLEAVEVFRRFSAKATVEELNAFNPLSSLCLAYDFTASTFGPALVKCNEKIGGICQEEATVTERETEFTEWYDVDQDTDDGNVESLNIIVDEHKKGNLPNARLCRSPVAMECREVGTDKMYSISNTHGYALRAACENLAIECINDDQPNGQKCPNFEIRFKCNVDPSTDCAVDSTRQNCESRGKECVMGLYGASCRTWRSQRTGYERIGVSQCTIDSIKYNVYYCTVQGARYSTFDSEKYDFHGKCSYRLVSTRADYRPTKSFPGFRIVKNNVVDPDGFNNTVAFDLTIGSVTYSFSGNYFFITKGTTIQTTPLGYSDELITISGEQGGSYVRYRIDTNFCMTILFDSEHGLQIGVPSSYAIRVLGMCGNFDHREENDIRLPRERDTTTPEILGDYYLVSSGVSQGKCADEMLSPDDCLQSDINTFKSNRHCGIFDSTQNSTLVSAILDLSVNQVKDYNRNQLNKLYQDCIRASCKNKDDDEFRCRYLDETIGKLILNVNLDDPDFPSQWREYVNCQNYTNAMCDGIPNTVFQEKYKPNCQDSCFQRDRSVQCGDAEERPGCVCKDGYYLDSRLKCVSAIECQKTCKVDLTSGQSLELNNGDTFVLEQCSKMIACKDGLIEDVKIGPCHEYAECVDYGRQCTCRQGFVGDGLTCNSPKPCRDGYHAIGDKCYKFVLRKADWHSAAISCGVDGSQLARWDSPIDVDLALYLRKVPQLYLESMATRVRRRCFSGIKCTPAQNVYITSVEIAYDNEKEACENNFRISNDKKFVIVTGGCQARFIIGYVDYNFAKSLKVEDFDIWIGGNTYVIGQWNQNGENHFQVDPPKLVDPISFGNEMGCFQARINSMDDLIVEPDPNCDKLKISLCEYDNTNENTYDPNDFKVIDEAVIYQEAIELCEAENRPLATITDEAQVEIVTGILSELGGDGWLGARYTSEAGQFLWPGNQPLLYDNWKTGEPDNLDTKQGISNLIEQCVSMGKTRGKWSSSECTRKFFPICGPPEGNRPTVFTSYFPISEPTSLSELKDDIRRSGIKNYVCSQPIAIECTARESTSGPWVTNENDESGSLQCDMNNFTCIDKGDLDCSTFQVRFLCPEDKDHCQSLKDLGVTPCDQQRVCVPVKNHYICRCPSGRKWNKYSKECTKPCGECHARGDPHYVTLGGVSYSFQGQCKYKFSGICEDDRNGTSASFDVYTQNVACGSNGASCLKSLDIRLFNMPVDREGVEERVDYEISVAGSSSDFQVNGIIFNNNQHSVPPAFSIVRRYNYFYLESGILDITILFSGHTVKLTIPEKFHDKMCGLCGQCGTTDLRMKDGSLATFGYTERGKKKDEDINAFANDWLYVEADVNVTKCKDVGYEPCAEDKLEELGEPDKCGIFVDNSGSLKECFDVVDATRFFEDCKFDACLEDPYEAICQMVKAYAQACKQKGKTLDWRTENFCPYTCTDGKVYRADASCSPTCGQSAAAREQCEEDPEEGCVCPRGKMQLGDKCVEENECGCVLLLNDGANEYLLPPGESLLMPGCRRYVTCEMKDGVASTLSEPYSLDANAICGPGIPPNIECRKGYKLAADNETCEEDPDKCKDNYEKRAEMCVDPQPDKKVWRQAIEHCNEKDGTLVKIKDAVQLEEIGDLMEENEFDSVFISGQVTAVVDGTTITFKPVLNDEEKGKIEYTNFDYNKSPLSPIRLSQKVDKSTVKSGDVFALLLILGNDGELSVKAVPRDTKANFICEERNPKDNETEWFGPCNSDSYMADGGDRETRLSLMMDKDCLVCSKPKDVRCESINASIGSVEGTCQITDTGTYYYCSEGASCIDNSVSLKCTKDVDECAEGLDDCSDRMICINTVGAYKCRCKKDYPRMVDGDCESEITCTMSTPDTPSGYVYDFTGFTDKAALFDYDCPFMMASVCEDSYDNTVPFVTFYVTSTRKSGLLKTQFVGILHDPKTKAYLIWSLTPESMAEGTIKIGSDLDSMFKTTVGFSVPLLQTTFSYLYPNGIIIHHIHNYFRFIIYLHGTVQVSFSEAYKDMMCGLCTMEPEGDGGLVKLTPEQEQEISIPYAKSCSKNGPSPNTTFTTTPFTTMAMMTTVAVPVTQLVSPQTTQPSLYPYCGMELLEVCDWLNRICQVSKAECTQLLCSGTVHKCEYLRSGSFGSCLMDDSLASFIELVNCDEECRINMKFQYTTIYNQPSCSLPMGISDESYNNDYGFTCVCADGYIYSGDKCIRNQNCGCTTIDGTYKPRGAIWQTKNCTEVLTCLGNDRVSRESRPCGPNTECKTSEEGYICKCAEGFFGDPDMSTGCKDAEVDEDDTKKCATFLGDDGSLKTECECKMGFRSNCESCEDIDECKEGLNDCDKRNEKCINIPGSYECDCADGFKAQDNICVDIDECSENTTNCKENEGCINEIGSFSCECCVGYRHNPETDECEADDAVLATLPENVRCCIQCPNPVLCIESMIKAIPYCYINEDGPGTQYPNFKALYQDFCINNKNLDKSKISRGPCRNDTNPTPTKPPSTGGGVPVKPLPQNCNASNLCDFFPIPKPLADGPVCGPSNVENPITFPTFCDMLRRLCESVGGPKNVPRQSPIDAKKGPCEPGDSPGGGAPNSTPTLSTEPLFTTWSEFGPCVPNDKAAKCGQGEQKRDRDVVPYDDLRPIRRVLNYETEEIKTCFKPCDPNDSTGKPVLCPDVTICDVPAPVCGYIGSQETRTYTSECELYVLACKEAEMPVKLNEGECDPDTNNTGRRCELDGPIMKKEEFNMRTGNIHCVGDEVTIGSCTKLLCDSRLDRCCRSKEVEPITVDIRCYDTNGDEDTLLRTEKRVYQSAVSCHCDSNSGGGPK